MEIATKRATSEGVGCIALLDEGRCSLSISRDTRGIVSIEARTHAFGMVRVELSQDRFAELIFGTCEVEGKIVKSNPLRKPSYSSNAKISREAN